MKTLVRFYFAVIDAYRVARRQYEKGHRVRGFFFCLNLYRKTDR